MHNNRLPQRVKMVLGRLPQSHFAPLVKCRHYGFSSDDIEELVTIWFRGQKLRDGCVTLSKSSKILLPCDEKSAWKINAKCSIFAVQNLGKKKGVLGQNGGDFGGFFLYLYIRW